LISWHLVTTQDGRRKRRELIRIVVCSGGSGGSGGVCRKPGHAYFSEISAATQQPRGRGAGRMRCRAANADVRRCTHCRRGYTAAYMNGGVCSGMDTVTGSASVNRQTNWRKVSQGPRAARQRHACQLCSWVFLLVRSSATQSRPMEMMVVECRTRSHRLVPFCPQCSAAQRSAYPATLDAESQQPSTTSSGHLSPSSRMHTVCYGYVIEGGGQREAVVGQSARCEPLADGRTLSGS
jgi:hypothetical protein